MYFNFCFLFLQLLLPLNFLFIFTKFFINRKFYIPIRYFVTFQAINPFFAPFCHEKEVDKKQAFFHQSIFRPTVKTLHIHFLSSISVLPT